MSRTRSQPPEGQSWPQMAEALNAYSAPPMSHFPMPGWPSKETVEYLSKLILLGLLLLAVPYLIGNLILRPAETLAAGAASALRGQGAPAPTV